MNQLLVGKFITQKRKEKNLTQEQLAEKIGVSNKTISKWETGKCMPDYSVIELLCEELNITLAELMNGEEDEKSIHTYDNEQIVKMLNEIQNLKAKKKLIIGFILLVMGGVMMALSQICGDRYSGFSFRCYVRVIYWRIFGRFFPSRLLFSL